MKDDVAAWNQYRCHGLADRSPYTDDGLIFDLLMGRLRLFAQFDMRQFFDMIRAEGFTPSWESRKKSEEYKRISEIIPGSPGFRGVRVEIPGLAADVPEQVLLSGFFGG